MKSFRHGRACACLTKHLWFNSFILSSSSPTGDSSRGVRFDVCVSVRVGCVCVIVEAPAGGGARCSRAPSRPNRVRARVEPGTSRETGSCVFVFGGTHGRSGGEGGRGARVWIRLRGRDPPFAGSARCAGTQRLTRDPHPPRSLSEPWLGGYDTSFFTRNSPAKWWVYRETRGRARAPSVFLWLGKFLVWFLLHGCSVVGVTWTSVGWLASPNPSRTTPPTNQKSSLSSLVFAARRRGGFVDTSHAFWAAGCWPSIRATHACMDVMGLGGRGRARSR